MRRSAARFGRAMAVSVAVLFVGCRPAPPPASKPLTAENRRNGLLLQVVVQPPTPRVGDVVKLSASLHTPANYAAQFPDAGSFGDLSVTVAPAAPPAATPDGLVWRQDYFIDPLIGGNLELPALLVRAGPMAPGASRPAASTQPLASDPAQMAAALASGLVQEIRVTPPLLHVQSALTASDSPEQPRDITGTLAAPPRPLTALEWTLLGVAVVLAVLLGWMCVNALRSWWRRPRPSVAPEVAALRALAELECENLVARGAAREFYYRLSEIVRTYIERKFALAAPEMTTEEFLRALADDQGALPYDAGKLRGFLEACDAVKYAALTPEAAEAQDALSSARAFVHGTAAAAAQRMAAPVGGSTAGATLGGGAA